MGESVEIFIPQPLESSNSPRSLLCSLGLAFAVVAILLVCGWFGTILLLYFLEIDGETRASVFFLLTVFSLAAMIVTGSIVTVKQRLAH